MTTPPRARVFHIRRDESPLARPAAETPPPEAGAQQEAAATPEAGATQERDPASLFETSGTEDGFGDLRLPGAGEKPAPDPHAAERAAVKAENLTARQLRMAKRIAEINGIEAEDEYLAVILLRQRGIDPFHRGSINSLVASEANRSQREPGANVPIPSPGTPNLPAQPRSTPVGPAMPLPSREKLTEDRRAAEIIRIQQDIARRRRRKLMMLMVRLSMFVFLPTIIAGWYFIQVATPLYATYTQFQIQQADSGGAGGGLGGLFKGTQLATNPDAVLVQNYLNSRDAMLRLDEDLGFKRAYQDPAIDPIQRLAPDATNEDTYKVYQKSVKISYDPTEGVVKMEVIAPDPQLSEAFSKALIGYAEEQIDKLTQRLRGDQMQGSQETFEDAEAKVREAQNSVLSLQEELGVLDPAAESGVVMGRINDLEAQLSRKRLELGQLLDNRVPNRSRVDAVEGEIARLEEMLANVRQQLTAGNTARGSLASIAGQLRIAEADLMTRQELLSAAATQMEAARIEANKQVRYLSVGVAPIAPDEATYPKAFQDTLVAFLVFAGIYLMLSLTASILREQVST